MEAKGKVLATDLDGTLFFPKRRIRMLSSTNKKFVRQFVDNGGRLVIVSGRNRFYAQKVIRRIKRPADVIGCNSAFIIANGKDIQTTLLDNKNLDQIIEEIKKRFHITGIFVMSDRYNLIIPRREFWWLHRFGYHIYNFIQGTYKEPSIHSDKLLHAELKHGKVYKIMLFFGITRRAKLRSLGVIRELRELYPAFEFSWCGQLIEMTKKGVTKANGIKHYLDYLKIKHDNIMVVGDSGNDISMLKSFKHSFCMSHAPLHVSQYARHIIDRVSDIEDYLTK
ncbi:MAG: Cof-type HAD-IIB family hydrolase [Bacilli bacterium]|nr:Cof-type HAD-IIB family hydrolase [Bacilli bacterium]